MENVFLKEYMCEWPRLSSAAYEAADEYDRLCEAYDQSVCRERNNRGIAIPITGEERRLVTRNARRVWAEMIEKIVRTEGVEPATAEQMLHNAIRSRRP